MRFNIDTLVRVIQIYDWEPVDNKETLIYNKCYEHPLDFKLAIDYIFSKSTTELRNEIAQLNSGVKSKLKNYLKTRGIAQEELHFRTGFRFEDVTLYTQYEEIKRLLED